MKIYDCIKRKIARLLSQKKKTLLINENAANIAIVDVADKISLVRNEIFSKYSFKGFGWDKAIILKQKGEATPFLSLHSVYEQLHYYEYALKNISKSQIKYSDWVFIANSFKDIFENIEYCLQALGSKDVIDEFKNTLDINEYNLDHNADLKTINLISKLRHSLNRDEKNFSETNVQANFWNFVMSLRNFAIHKNSSGYNIVFFSDFDAYSEDTLRVKFKAHREHIDFSVSIMVFIRLLNSFFDFLIENKNGIVANYGGMTKNNASGNLLKIPADHEIKLWIKNYWNNRHNNLDFIGKCIDPYSSIYGIIDSAKVNPSLLDLTIHLVKIVVIHMRNNFYDENFENSLPVFEQKTYCAALGIEYDINESYNFQQFEEFPEYLTSLLGDETINILDKQPISNLHCCVKLKVYEKFIEKHPEFTKNIEEYAYHCLSGGNPSYPEFLKNKTR